MYYVIFICITFYALASFNFSSGQLDDTKNATSVETEKVLLELFPRQNSQTINLLGLTGNENQPFKSKRGNTLKGGISRENETTIKDEK